MKKSVWQNLRGDILAGLTAGIVALPLAMAFGVQSGLGAAAGLYGAIALGIFAALLGGTVLQVSGPTGPMTVVSSLLVASIISVTGSVESGLGIILLTFALAGVFQIVFGILRLGQLIHYVPYPVVSGFMSGIGAIIISLQIYPLMGHPSPAKIVDAYLGIAEPLSNINFQALLLGALSVAIIYSIPKITKAVPGSLVALIVVSLIPQFVEMNVPKIGDIPSGLPTLHFEALTSFQWPYAGLIFGSALTLAALASIDSLLTSLVADNLTRTRHESNRELIGQGIGNFVSGLIGGLPGAGATMRTVVNIRAGAKTRLSGAIHGFFLLAVLLGLGPYAAEIPLAVLAGILITVGIGIIDYKGLRDSAKIPRTDASIMIIVLGVTVFVDLLWAVAIGIVLACIAFMKTMADQSIRSLKTKPIRMMPENESEITGINPLYLSPHVYIHELKGPLFFGFASKFQELFHSLPAMKAAVFRFEHVPFLDQSGLYALEGVIRDLLGRNVIVNLTGVRAEVKDQLKKMEIVPGLVHEGWIFNSFPDCADWLGRNLKEDRVTWHEFKETGQPEYFNFKKELN